MSFRLFILTAALFFSVDIYISAQKPVIISGTILNGRSDTLTITIHEDEFIEKINRVEIPLINNQFSCQFTVPGLVSVDITDGIARLVDILVEPGESISFKADFKQRRPKPEVTGKGKEKFLFWYEMKGGWPGDEKLSFAKSFSHPLDYLFHLIDSVADKNLLLFNSYKNKIFLIHFLLRKKSWNYAETYAGLRRKRFIYFLILIRLA